MKKFAYFISVLFLGLVFQGCSDSSNEPDSSEKPNTPSQPTQEENIDWQGIAEKSTQSLIAHFWNSGKNFFNTYPDKADTPNEDWNYWPQAHAMDVLIDAYQRTGDSKYKSYFSKWYEGVTQKSGGSYFNDFNDDMEWICLTMIRLYENTQESKYLETAQSLWNKIKESWNEQAGGGISWKQSQPWSKNACSNGPAGIIAARLYQINQDPEDLEWAIKIYEWQGSTLFDLASGKVFDNINGETGVITEWLFTYNQGTHLGMAHELYKITGEDYYLRYACKAANYCISGLIDTSNNILKDEGTGDGGLFKGIFVRYFIKLILEEDLSESDRKRYVNFFNNNAEVLWEKGCNQSDILYGSSWGNPGTSNSTDLQTQVSGCTMMEAKAFYERTIK